MHFVIEYGQFCLNIIQDRLLTQLLLLSSVFREQLRYVFEVKGLECIKNHDFFTPFVGTSCRTRLLFIIIFTQDSLCYTWQLSTFNFIVILSSLKEKVDSCHGPICSQPENFGISLKCTFLILMAFVFSQVPKKDCKSVLYGCEQRREQFLKNKSCSGYHRCTQYY